MKKFFNFTENSFILDRINIWLKNKIKKRKVALGVACILDILFMVLYLGFYIMPFLTYSTRIAKVIFSVLWIISCFLSFFSIVDTLKKSNQEIGFTSYLFLVCIFVFFALCFVNNNFFYLGTLWQLAICIVIGLFAINNIYDFVNELIKNPKDTLSSVVLSLMIIIGVVCIVGSSLSIFESDVKNKVLIVGVFCVGVPTITMMLAYVLKIDKPVKLTGYAFFCAFCVLVIMGISQAISCLNPDINVYQTFVTLFASLLGGGLTLVGVAWTIKKQEQDRKEEEKKKAKPIFAFNRCDFHVEKEKVLEKTCKISIPKREFDEIRHQFKAEIENSNMSGFTLERVFHQGQWYTVSGNKTVLPSGRVTITFSDKRIKNLYFEIFDFLNNKYYYEVKTEISSIISGEMMQYTISQIIEISLEKMEEIITEQKTEN